MIIVIIIVYITDILIMGLDDTLQTYVDPDEHVANQGQPVAKMPRTEIEDTIMATFAIQDPTSIRDMAPEIILKMYYDAFGDNEYRIKPLNFDPLRFIAYLDVLNAAAPVSQISYNLARALDILFQQEMRPEKIAEEEYGWLDKKIAVQNYYAIFVMMNWSQTCRKSAYVYATPEDEATAIRVAANSIQSSGKHMEKRWNWFVKTFHVPPMTPEEILHSIYLRPWPWVKLVTTKYPIPKHELLTACTNDDFEDFDDTMPYMNENVSDWKKRLRWMFTHYQITKDDFIHYWFERFTMANEPHVLRGSFVSKVSWTPFMNFILEIYPVFTQEDIDRMMSREEQLRWIDYDIDVYSDFGWIFHNVKNLDAQAITSTLDPEKIMFLRRTFPSAWSSV